MGAVVTTVLENRLKPTVFRSVLLAASLSFALPVLAESLTTSASSAASSASSAGSASLGASSDSISGSSRGGERKDAKVEDGEYRVTRIEPVDGRPDALRLTLAPVASGDEDDGFRLALPKRAFGERPVAIGDAILAQRRPYGFEFARGRTREPFFLVIADDWQRDLQTRVVER